MPHLLCLKSISHDGKCIAKEPTQRRLNSAAAEALHEPGSRAALPFLLPGPKSNWSKRLCFVGNQRRGQSPAQRTFCSVLSSEGGAGSQAEHVKSAEVRSETISLALSERRDAPGRISALLCCCLNFWGMLPWRSRACSVAEAWKPG